MFRLGIFSRIQIQYFSRSIRVIRGQTWVKPVQQGLNRAGWSEYIKYTYFSSQNVLKNSNFIFFKVNQGHQRSNLGQTRPMGVKSGRLVRIYQICICFDSEFSQEFRFNIFKVNQGHQRSKLGQNRQKGVESGRLVEIYPICICFDSKCCQGL